MNSQCTLCLNSVSASFIARSGSITEFHCPHCGSYRREDSAARILNNLREANEFNLDDQGLIRSWINENREKIITDEVILKLFSRNIREYQKKRNLEMFKMNE